MVKNKILLSLLLSLLILGCDNEVYEKPEKLIKEDKMVEIIVDLHLSQAIYNHFRYNKDNWIYEVSTKSFYQSVLKEHNVSDKRFEESYVYYASRPRKFEKLYSNVTSKLNRMEERLQGEKLDIEEKSENLQ